MSSTSSADSDTASIFSYATSSSSATSTSSDVPCDVDINKTHGSRQRLPSTISVHTTGNTQLALPRVLSRPQLKQVSASAIAAVDDELSGVPLPYIIQSLKDIGPRMMAALARTTAPAPTSLPRELTVSIAPETASESAADPSLDPLPTHLLAVYARSGVGASMSRPRKVTLFPTHAIVLAAHCAHLPELPPGRKRKSKAREGGNDDGGGAEAEEQSTPEDIAQSEDESHPAPDQTEPEASYAPIQSSKPIRTLLPVVPLCIPAPPMFPVLQTYLYTKRADHLLGALVPNPQRSRPAHRSPPPTPTASSPASSTTPTPASPYPRSTPTPASPRSRSTPTPPPASPSTTSLSFSSPSHIIPSAPSFARLLAATQPQQTLVHAALRTHGLWANAAALGVIDERLWLTIDFAWRVLLGALECNPKNRQGDDEDMVVQGKGVGVSDSEARGGTAGPEADAADIKGRCELTEERNY